MNKGINMKRFCYIFVIFALIIAVVMTAGCKGKGGKIAKKIIVDQAVDTVVDNATGNNGGNKNGKVSKGKVAAATAATTGAVAAGVSASSTDLILGNIYIGQSEKEVLSIKGAPIKVSDPNNNGHLHCKYSDMVVVVKNGVVTGFVSETSSVTTKRGVSQGSTLDTVLQKYGNSYFKSNYDGMELYEYEFTSDMGQKSLLRFAVRNGVVDYISARVL